MEDFGWATETLTQTLRDEYQRLEQEVEQEGLAGDHEVQLLVRNHAGEEVRVTRLDQCEPDLLMFVAEGDDTVQLIAQTPPFVSVTFRVVKTTGAPRRLGFTPTRNR